jgi:hypothetical protein
VSLTTEPVGTGAHAGFDADQFRRGATLCSRYRLSRVIGSGGMATVWLAQDEVLERPVAVKVMAERLASDAAFVARFEREARIAASVWHPNLVQIYDYSVASGRPFLVMEHLPGGSLDERLQRVRLSSAELRELSFDLLSALSCIHRRGILHRDVKPANVLLDGLGRARLTDFGIAQAATDSTLTSTGHVMGTLRYLAPEIKEGGSASARSDLYALGAVLEQVPLRGEVDAELAALIASLCHPRPEARPHSADQALRQLARSARAGQDTEEFDVLALIGPEAAAGRSEPTATTEPTAPTRVRPRPPLPASRSRRARFAGRGRLAAAGAAVALILAVLLVGMGGGGTPARKSAQKGNSVTLARSVTGAARHKHHATTKRPAPSPTQNAVPPAQGAGHSPPGHDKAKGHGHGHGHGG